MRIISYWSFVICLLLAPIHVRAELSDIEFYPHKSSVQLLESRGIINGYPDGSFRPEKAINRAEFLKLLMLSVFGDQAYQGGSERCFTDFAGNYQWYWAYACTAKLLGVIHGHPDGSFRGEDTIILAEALKMAFEAWKVPLPVDDPDQPWYQRYMDTAAPRGVFRRFPFTPDYQLTRGEMALLLVMIGEPIASLTGDTEDDGGTKLIPVIFPPTATVCGNGIVEGAEQCDDGNTQDGDGCSRICILVSEPVRHGALRLEQQPISTSPQASGNLDVPVFAFTAIAGRQDVYITNLKFKSTVGSLQNAENYRLLIDRDEDGTVDTLFGRAVPSGETINFSNLNILVRDGGYTRVEIWADIDTTFTAGSIALGFDTTQPDFVEGVDKIDGEDVTGIKLNDDDCTLESICWITVITDDDQTVTIRTKGNLFVSEDTVPLGSRQIIASTETPSLLLLKFRSDAEDVKVKELAIEGIPTSVDHLLLYESGSPSAFATARLVNCDSVVTGRFCSDNEFIVPQNGEKSIVVKASLKSDDTGAVSGQSVSLAVSAATTGNVAIKAEGFYSGQQLLQNDGNVSGEGEIFIGTETVTSNSLISAPTHTVVLAKIVDITNTNPDPDGTNITAGAMTFAQFAFRAGDHENSSNGFNTAEITKLVFTVSAVNMEFNSDSFYLYNIQNSSVISDCTGSATTGTITVTCDGLDTSSVSTSISRGDTIQLALHGTVTASQVEAGVSILQANLQNLSNPGVTGTINWTDGETSLGWVDIGKTNVKSTNYRLD
ncbi:MAG: S-layer homology domain-containing protein [Candidatus Peribacteraceae bacterium]|nr:S-layer homology domain-containing protein [Candidatus Peribacteraceae bacterium]|tara:strand:- start:78 stop:2399 length:2322 start_codon:yes stop_codon:yes gene_type:complete